jgi:hypothetical protein
LLKIIKQVMLIEEFLDFGENWHFFQNFAY